MSEKTKSNPNQVRLTRRGKLARTVGLIAGVGLGLTAAVNAVSPSDSEKAHDDLVTNLQRPDALQEYIKGDRIPHDKAVRLESPDDMAPWTFAKEITKDDESQWELSQQIQPQADAQNFPGLQGGEQVVVERDLVSDEALQQYQVEEPGEAPVDPEN